MFQYFDFTDDFTMFDTDVFADPEPKQRKRKAPTLRDSDWEPHKERILDLYTSDVTLEELRHVMQDDFKFSAEIRQYKSQLKKWGLGKNVTSTEMKAIVRKRQDRKILEPDRPELIFQVRRTEVGAGKIDRWMDRHSVSQGELYAPISAGSTPSAIDCRTISVPNSPLSDICPTTSSPSPHIVSCQSIDAQFAATLGIQPSANGDIMWHLWANFFHRGNGLPRILGLDEDFLQCAEWTKRYLASARGWSQTGPKGRICMPYIFNFPFTKNNPTDKMLLGVVLKFWLDLGAAIEHRFDQDQGNTPLLSACYRGSLINVLLLTEYRANVHAVNDQGHGALHLAMMQMHIATTNTLYAVNHSTEELIAIIWKLIRVGCNPYARDHQGRTPAQCVPPYGPAWSAWRAMMYDMGYPLGDACSGTYALTDGVIVVD